MAQPHFFSYIKASGELCDKQNLLSQISLNGIEICGDFFESERFHDFYLKCFELEKKISSVYGVLPANLLRNWSSADEAIQQEILRLLKKKLQRAQRYGIEFFILDTGLDTIGAGNEYAELQQTTPQYQLLGR